MCIYSYVFIHRERINAQYCRDWLSKPGLGVREGISWGNEKQLQAHMVLRASDYQEGPSLFLRDFHLVKSHQLRIVSDLIN